MNKMEVALDSLCCAMGEFNGLNSPQFNAPMAVQHVAEEGEFAKYGGGIFAHVLMTQMWISRSDKRRDNIFKMRDYIHKHRLGVVNLGAVRTNPNTGNKVQPAVWSLNQRALEKWIDKRLMTHPSVSRRNQELNGW